MTNITDRMRTCAARIVAVASKEDIVYNDAANLLIEASNIIEAACEPYRILGEPMEVMKPWVENPLSPIKQKVPPPNMPPGVWIDEAMGTLPGGPKSLNACPKCDSRASKTARISDRVVWLVCPVCEHAWKR